MSTQAVIFDFGRVLGNFDKKRACTHFAETSPFYADEIGVIIAAQLEKQLESGQMSETVFCHELLRLCEVKKLTMPDVLRIWGNIFSPNPAIDPVVDALIANGVRIGVLSNTNGIHWPYIMDLPVMRKLAKYGAPFTLSYKIGAYKPDLKMFETALKSLDVAPENALYLDDIPEYVVAARKLGIHAEEYDCTKNPGHISEIVETYELLKESV